MEWIKRTENSRGTLKEAFTAKYDGILPRTPWVRPKSKIYNLQHQARRQASPPLSYGSPPYPPPPGLWRIVAKDLKTVI